MDRFESMSAFVAVARAGGFSAAARTAGVPLATLSRRVADLERELGARLLHRTTRKVALTERGEAYFATCRRLLEDLRDAEEAVSGEYRTPKGELAVTAPVGFGRLHLQPVAIEFLAAYPEVNLRLLLVDRVVNLVEEHVDLALRIAELGDSGLVARPLGQVRVVICASPAYLRRRGTPRAPSELAAHDCVAWGGLGPASTWSLQDGASVRAFPVRARLTTTTPDSAIAAAVAGLGLVQATCYQVEQAVREGSLELLLRDYELPPRPVSLVYASSRLLPLKLRAFIDFAAPRLIARLHAISATVDRPVSAAEPPRARKRRPAR